jgi:hypothetical protein
MAGMLVVPVDELLGRSRQSHPPRHHKLDAGSRWMPKPKNGFVP